MYEINNLTFRYMLSDRNSLEQVSLKIKKGKITLIAGPSGSGKTTLLRHLKKEEYPVRLDLKEEDDRVIRYLKGETISLVNEEGPVKGWCLVTVEGFPLGWAKGSGMTLKNKYYAGWRWQ